MYLKTPIINKHLYHIGKIEEFFKKHTWFVHQIGIRASSDLGSMANRRNRALAAEELQEAGETPILFSRTSTIRLLSVENSLEGIRETLDAIVRRLDEMIQLQPEEEQSNL